MDGETDTLDIGGAAADGASREAGLVTLYAPDPALVPSAIAFPAHGLVVGREPPPGGLALPFNSVSRVHALVRAQDSEIVVEDLDSRNGTVVNGTLVRKATVEHGDEIRVGEVVLKVVQDRARELADYSLVGRVPAAPLEGLRGGLAMEKVRQDIVRAAKADLSVLILGETGTGKEMVARGLHDASGRSGRMCAVNCAAIPSALLESELFGYKKGAFTGADRDRVGLVKSANGGTLFLDEIGDMPIDAQAKVLRLIETRSVTPLGGHFAEPVDVRIVCATHRALPRFVREERFRADLYARISGITIHLPPLRERKEDLYQLTRLFVDRAGGAGRVLAPSFMIGICAHDWPYNVRELESAVKRALSLTNGTLEGAHLMVDSETASDVGSEPVGRAIAPPESKLRALLAQHDGNVAAVARALRKDRVQVHRWMKRYGLSPGEFRS